MGAGPRRPVPRHAVPDRGARRRTSRRCSARRSSRPAARRPACSTPSGAKPVTIGFDERFLERPLNVDLSGGEKKRNETLQLAVLQPRIAVLDEIDSGLDVDALRAVSRRIEVLTNETGLGVLAITHYSRLLHELKPDRIHILVKGEIRASGRSGAGGRARRPPATPRSPTATEPEVEVMPHLDDPFADPLRVTSWRCGVCVLLLAALGMLGIAPLAARRDGAQARTSPGRLPASARRPPLPLRRGRRRRARGRPVRRARCGGADRQPHEPDVGGLPARLPRAPGPRRLAASARPRPPQRELAWIRRADVNLRPCSTASSSKSAPGG